MKEGISRHLSQVKIQDSNGDDVQYHMPCKPQLLFPKFVNVGPKYNSKINMKN